MRTVVRLGLCIGVVIAVSSVGLAQAIGGPAGPGGPAGGTYTGELPAPAPGPNVSLISGVPAYLWYNGCGPTALGMMVGYWDAHGFPNLIPGSNDWATNQPAIEAAIASAGHIRDYVPTPDRTPTTGDPYHADDSLADFSECSRDPLEHGWSYFNKQGEGLQYYSTYRGYFSATAQYNLVWPETLWNEFVADIDAGKPVQLMVDTDGNAKTDHFVTAIGYDSTPGARKYACYTTWEADVHWFEFEMMASGQYWGVCGGTFYHPMPEPATAAMLLLGMAVLALRRRRR